MSPAAHFFPARQPVETLSCKPEHAPSTIGKTHRQHRAVATPIGSASRLPAEANAPAGTNTFDTAAPCLAQLTVSAVEQIPFRVSDWQTVHGVELHQRARRPRRRTHEALLTLVSAKAVWVTQVVERVWICG